MNIEPHFGELISKATEARNYAYAPYSKYMVGAAVLTEKGIYTGCNIENASFGGSVCAERVAVFKAISDGARHLFAMAIITDSAPPGSPCGICRQVMSEFGPSCSIIMANLKGDRKVYSLADLLPVQFSLNDKGKNKS